MKSSLPTKIASIKGLFGKVSSVITTKRLKLVPASAQLVRAEMENRALFAELLDATVSENWPPENLADALPLFLEWIEAAPEQVGWFGWYALANEENRFFLVGSGGFMGPPKEGEVELGYCVLPQFQGAGYATEMVQALTTWAFSRSGVLRIAAETEWANPASVRVLTKAGFTPAGCARDPNGERFELVVNG